MEYYRNYATICANADEDTRRESRRHWAKCEKENIESNRADLICWSSRHIGILDGVEAMQEIISEAETERATAEAARILDALDVLDAQYKHSRRLNNSEQTAFYEGARLMLEVVTDWAIVERDEQTGKHRITRKESK